MTPRPISPQIQGRIIRVFKSAHGNPDQQYKNVRDVVKREVFDFNTRYNETPTADEDTFIDEVTLESCFNLWLSGGDLSAYQAFMSSRAWHAVFE